MVQTSRISFDWLERRCELSPDKEALVDLSTGRRFTYRQFNHRANRLANGWREKWNIKKGDRIGVLATNCPEYLEALYAAGKLGAILVPINVRLVGEELTYLLQNCDPQGLILGGEFLNLISNVKGNLGVSNYLSLVETTVEDMPFYEDFLTSSSDRTPKLDEPVSLDDPRLILYTSGTTGYPKGAIITNGNILFNCINVILHDEMTSGTINLSCVPFFHIAGLNILTNPTIYVGGTVVIMKSFDAAQVMKVVHERRVNSLFLIPTMWRFICLHQDFDRTDFSGLRIATSGGEAVPLSVIEDMRKKSIALTQGFGLTESGPSSIVQKREDVARKQGSIGLPLFHVDLRIVDENGADIPSGQTGEIILRGPSITPGYWNNPEATAKAIRDGWLFTGDLGFRDEEGHVYIRGRKKDMILSGGENIYPAEIERILGRHPKIAEVAVFGVPDKKWGEVGHAAVCTKAGETLTENEVIDFLRDKLARYKTPKSIFFMETLPKAASGKVIKRILRESYLKDFGEGKVN
jgi:fatty-acyl-CoA synthase